MSRALELIKLAREGNASRFGDVMVAGIQERVAAAVAAKRSAMAEGKNPFAKDDDDKDDDDKSEKDEDEKSEKEESEKDEKDEDEKDDD